MGVAITIPRRHLDLQGARSSGACHGHHQGLLPESQVAICSLVIIVGQGRRIQHHPDVVTTGERQVGSGENLLGGALASTLSLCQQHQSFDRRAGSPPPWRG